MSVKVIAIGNILMKDDAIAIEVAREVEAELLEKGIEVIYGETDFEYCISMAGEEDYIFVLIACPYEKANYERLIKVQTDQLINFLKYSASTPTERIGAFERQMEFTLEELATYDGASGRAAYVAVNGTVYGTVYDVSKEATWGGGTHFGLYAGKNLSAEFMGCHKEMVEILNKLPKVGLLKK